MAPQTPPDPKSAFFPDVPDFLQEIMVRGWFEGAHDAPTERAGGVWLTGCLVVWLFVSLFVSLFGCFVPFPKCCWC